uniref:Putative ixodes 10 kDa peptide protein n=1 Tax=Ixodes ricinus TaxID=34613 RepID=A0A0K8RB69_IXORI
MRLVLLTVVVILPTTVQGMLLEEIEERRCFNLVREGGRIVCILRGHEDYGSFNGGNCSLVCKDKSFSAKLPEGVCNNVGMRCTRTVIGKLERWKSKLDKWLNDVRNMVCTASGTNPIRPRLTEVL